MCCFEKFGVAQRHTIVKHHNTLLHNGDYKSTPQCRQHQRLSQTMFHQKRKLKTSFSPKAQTFSNVERNNRNLTLKRCCRTASGGMVVIVVDSLPLESIPSSIVAIAGVSSYGDSLPLRFSNTRTSLCLHFLRLSLSLSHQHFTLSPLSPPFSLLVSPANSFCQKKLSG